MIAAPHRRLRQAIRGSVSRQGYGLPELLVVLAVLALALASVGPPLAAGLEGAKAAAGTRAFVGRLHTARLEAIRRSTAVAFWFTRVGSDVTFQLFADGDGDGVRLSDIADGEDLPIEPPRRLEDDAPGMRFGLCAEAADAEGGDPIRVGSSDLLTFTPFGGATPGSLFLLGARDRQYAVRVLGQTGRVRVERWDSRNRRWTP
jgi:prepilin-type N-terminal cleavage/methylation domain-containing protein